MKPQEPVPAGSAVGETAAVEGEDIIENDEKDLEQHQERCIQVIQQTSVGREINISKTGLDHERDF